MIGWDWNQSVESQWKRLPASSYTVLLLHPWPFKPNIQFAPRISSFIDDTVDVILDAVCLTFDISDCKLVTEPLRLLIVVVLLVTFDSMLFAFCVNVATLLVMVVIVLSISVFFSVHSVTFAPSSIFGFVITTVLV